MRQHFKSIGIPALAFIVATAFSPRDDASVRHSIPPTLYGVIASAEQPTGAAVRAFRAGTATLTGKNLFTPGTSTRSEFSTVVTSPPVPPVVKLGGLALTVTAMRHVAAAPDVVERDSVRVTLPDPPDNVVGQFSVETGGGSANTTSSFLLATRPRVNLITEVTTDVRGERAISNQTLTRGRQYQIAGAALSVRSSTQLLQAGTVRIGNRLMLMQPTADPVAQLRFFVPAEATTGPLVVSTFGGETTIGTFTVADPVAGSIATPRVTGLAISVASVPAGRAAAGTVVLDIPGASVAEFSVALSSSHPNVVRVPETLRVPQSSAQFTIETTTVAAPQTVTITATGGGTTQSQTFTVTPAVPVSLSLNASDVVAGKTLTGTLVLTGPVSNTSATFTSSDAAVPIPASVPITGNTATFSITTTEAPAPRDVTIRGSVNGVTKSTFVTIRPVRFASVTMSRDTIRGQPATITATFERAPAAHVPLTFTTSRPELAQFDESTLPVASDLKSFTIELRRLVIPTVPTRVTFTISRSVVTAAFGTITATSPSTAVTIAP